MSYIGQAEDEWEAKERKKAKARKAASKPPCPVCGKRCKNVVHHAKDVHNVVVVPFVQPKFMVKP